MTERFRSPFLFLLCGFLFPFTSFVFVAISNVLVAVSLFFTVDAFVALSLYNPPRPLWSLAVVLREKASEYFIVGGWRWAFPVKLFYYSLSLPGVCLSGAVCRARDTASIHGTYRQTEKQSQSPSQPAKQTPRQWTKQTATSPDRHPISQLDSHLAS